MNEEATTPYVDWEYCVVTEDGALHDDPRILATQLDRLPPGSAWHIEFQGRTRGDELLLASYHPSVDERAREWLEAFESGTLPTIPVSIDTYFGPQSEPHGGRDAPDGDLKDVEHCIFIGNGWARWQGSALFITLASEVFRDAAASLLSSLGTEYAHIEQRIFQIFTLIDPDGFSRFLSALDTLQVRPPVDTTCLIHHVRKPTCPHVLLKEQEVISVLGNRDGVMSFQQLYTHLPCQDRTLRQWLREAGMVEAGHKRLTGWLFTSDEILNRFVPWLRNNLRTDGARTFIRNLIIAGLIPR